MQIKFASRHGFQQVEARDLLSDGYRVWSAGEVKDVPEDQVISVRLPNDQVIKSSAIKAIFAMGPNFVDVATGINPNYACARCGQESLSETYTDRTTMAAIPFQDAEGKRLCLTDFLAEHPELDHQFAYAGLPAEVAADVKARREPSHPHAAPAPIESEKV